jgi:hypothetical protein
MTLRNEGHFTSQRTAQFRAISVKRIFALVSDALPIRVTTSDVARFVQASTNGSDVSKKIRNTKRVSSKSWFSFVQLLRTNAVAVSVPEIRLSDSFV